MTHITQKILIYSETTRNQGANLIKIITTNSNMVSGIGTINGCNYICCKLVVFKCCSFVSLNFFCRLFKGFFCLNLNLETQNVELS